MREWWKLEIRKEAGLGGGRAVDAEELALINTQSKKELTAQEVYAFTVRLCDNEIDRDWERFAPEALEQLAERFVGKSGIFDHDWSARGQAARIYKTEVVDEESVTTGAGDGYRYLKGYAYMLRTEGNRDLIAEIEGGIKKEVSIGCSAARALCSVCGEDIHSSDVCTHVKGRTYNGKLCWAELRDVTDAYEWSFVAVPAQRKAGVIKGFREGAEDVEKLEQEAQLGRRYLSALREDVVRLGALAEPQLKSEVRRRMAQKLDEEELLALRKCYESRVGERYPVGTQLSYCGEGEHETRDGAFLI